MPTRENLQNAQGNARDRARIADLNNIMAILEVYYADYQGYPKSLPEGECIGTGFTVTEKIGIDASLENYVKGGILPVDPSKNTVIGSSTILSVFRLIFVLM